MMNVPSCVGPSACVCGTAKAMTSGVDGADENKGVAAEE